MAPTKSTTRAVTSQAAMNALLPTARKGLTRRGVLHDQNAENIQTRSKRKAENSPIKNEKIKRSALGNLTNNVKIMTLHPEDIDKKQIQTLLDAKKLVCNAMAQQSTMVQPSAPPTKLQQQQSQQNKVITRAASKSDEEVKLHDDAIENCHKVLDRYEEMLASRTKRKPPPKKAAPIPAAPIVVPVVPVLPKVATKPVRRISNEFNKTEESLYMSALEDVSSCDSMRLSGNFEAARRRSAQIQMKTAIEVKSPEELAPSKPVNQVPDGVEDFDKLNWNDPFQVSHYAMDIFNYMKEREKEFPIADYMPKQIHLSKWMRTLLVDWMVEVQETFELNHETLYLAVKIVDLYLCRKVINKEKLQLLGAAALFISCKFDERQPPLIDDFLYICDGAYKHDELVRMEMETLRTIDYDLGIPLSYRFLRRYARCAKVQMPTLTLARYILELSLMDYATIALSDSQMAAAALFMALRMHASDSTAAVWTPTLIYYTGYQLSDFAEIVPILNAGLQRKPKGTIKTIRTKYSHRIFHEVAKVPLLSNDELFRHNLDISASLTN